jgi:hypothetical protein
MSNCRPCRPDESAGTESRQMSVVKELFERWGQISREHPCGLGFVRNAPPYIRRDQFVGRIVTPEDYLQEIANSRPAALNAHCVVYERTVIGERAWHRIAIEWLDAVTGETCRAAGLQLLRFEAGRLAETWLMLSPSGPAKTDAIAPAACSNRPTVEMRGYGRPGRKRGFQADCPSARASQ